MLYIQCTPSWCKLIVTGFIYNICICFSLCTVMVYLFNISNNTYVYHTNGMDSYRDYVGWFSQFRCNKIYSREHCRSTNLIVWIGRDHVWLFIVQLSPFRLSKSFVTREFLKCRILNNGMNF